MAKKTVYVIRSAEPVAELVHIENNRITKRQVYRWYPSSNANAIVSELARGKYYGVLSPDEISRRANRVLRDSDFGGFTADVRMAAGWESAEDAAAWIRYEGLKGCVVVPVERGHAHVPDITVPGIACCEREMELTNSYGVFI